MTLILAPDGRPVASTQLPAVREARRSTLVRTLQTRVTSGLESVLAVLPSADEIMLQEGADVYDKMRADDAVFAAEFQLMTRLLARPWDVRPPQHLASDNFAVSVADHVKSVFNDLGTDAMLEHLYRAVRHRHSGGQLVYREESGYLVPDDFIPERRDIFRFGHGGVRLVSLQGRWEEAAPFKWQTHVNEPEPNRPGGRSMLSRVYWPWKFKRLGWEFWVQAMDRFAVPSLAALFELTDYDQTKAQALADDLVEQLANIANGSVGALANVNTLQQIGGTRAIEGFDVFAKACDQSIYRGILTVTLTVAEGGRESERGNTEVHDQSADEVAKWYGRQIAESVTKQTAAYAALLRFGEDARRVLSRFEFDWEEHLSFENLLKLMEANFPVSRAAVYSRFASEVEPTGDEDVFVNPRWLKGGTSGDGATASVPTVTVNQDGEYAVIRVPASMAEEAERRLYTLSRNAEIQARFKALRYEGATWEEALDSLEEEGSFGVSRSTIRKIVTGKN